MAAIVLMLLLLTISSVFSAPIGVEHQYLENALHSIEKLIHYYRSSYRNLNIDGLYGLRVLEGQLSIILEENAGNQNVSTNIMARVKACVKEATEICTDAVRFVKAEDEEYYKMLHFVVGRPWTLHKPYKDLNFTMQWPSEVYLKNTKFLTESNSDKCMSQLTGMLKVPSRKCQSSDDCIEIMTKKGMSGYSITHQLLWTMLAEQAGCFENVQHSFQSHGKGSVEDLQKELCTNNFFEMIQVVFIVMKGKVLPRLQDLFLEQQFVCPNLGFHQFLSLDFLEQIMTWQKDNGCYGIMPLPKNAVKNIKSEDYDYDGVEGSKNALISDKNTDQAAKPGGNGDSKIPVKQLTEKPNIKKSLEPIQVGYDNSNINKSPVLQDSLKVQQTGNVVIQNGQNLVEKYPEQKNVLKLPTERNPVVDFMKDKQNEVKMAGNHRKLLYHDHRDPGYETFKGRKLLAEKVMGDGCLAHKTAVAAGALSMYLKYLLKPGPVGLRENSEYLKQHTFLSGDILLNTYEDAVKAAFGKINPPNKKNVGDNDKNLPVIKGIPVKLNDDKSELSAKNDNTFIRREALNNNVLAAQLHVKNGDEDNVYYDNDHEKDDDYKEDDDDDDDLYPQSKGKAGQQHKMVQFDNMQGEDVNKKGVNNDKDDYKEDNEGGDGKDYDYNEEDGNQIKDDGKGEDNNKNDDRDYPYYDNNNHNIHDDYTNEKEEKELLEKVEKNHLKSAVDNTLQNGDIHTSISDANPPTMPTKTFFMITACSTIFLLLLMYRVIRSRRIHIRYSLRSFMRL